MVHSADFSQDACPLNGAGFARTFFSSHNFSTHSYANPEKTLLCLFSGYLRDFPKLREQVRYESSGQASVSTPADLFAYLLPRHGIQILANLSGSFVFALWDSTSQTLQLGSDRFGMAPLYFRHSGAQLLFASEIKALLAIELEASVNLAALEELCAFGSPLGEDTLYPSIHRLPVGSVMTFRNGQVTYERHWWFDKVFATRTITLPDFLDEAQRLLSTSIASLMQQVENPICLLSAGFDSRRILLELVKHSPKLISYTAPIVDHNGNWMCDVTIARALCHEYGVPHIGINLPPPSDQGQITRYTRMLLDFETDSHAWILPLISEIPAGSGVNFDGLGGDVFCDAHFTYQAEADHMDDPAWLARSIETRFSNLWESHFRLKRDALPFSTRLENQLTNLPYFDHRHMVFFFSNWSRRKTALQPNGLLSLKIDSVFPFLDYELTDFLLSVSPMWKRTNEVCEAMLRRSHPELMQKLPSSHTPNIFTNPGPASIPFCEKVPPRYHQESLESLYQTASSDIMAGKGVLPQLSRHAQTAAFGFWGIRPQRLMPRAFTNRSWPLRLAGLYAQQRRTVTEPDWAKEQTVLAQEYIYHRKPVATPASTIKS